jgi:hypothetical protein
MRKTAIQVAGLLGWFLLGGGCGGETLSQSDGTVEKDGEANWTEPAWNINGGRNCDRETGCVGLSYWIHNAQFRVKAGNRHNTALISIGEYVPRPDRYDDLEGGAHWDHNFSWTELISSSGRSQALWPNPSHGGWGTLEVGCLVNQGDWCINHGADNKPLWQVTSACSASPPNLPDCGEHVQRIIHHEESWYEDEGVGRFVRDCFYDLTNFAAGTWTFNGCR